jgi:hypothetical protein
VSRLLFAALASLDGYMAGKDGNFDARIWRAADKVVYSGVVSLGYRTVPGP